MAEIYIQNIIPGHFPIFTDIFRQWFSLIERYNRQRLDDVPWWYNEIASLSFLLEQFGIRGALRWKNTLRVNLTRKSLGQVEEIFT